MPTICFGSYPWATQTLRSAACLHGPIANFTRPAGRVNFASLGDANAGRAKDKSLKVAQRMAGHPTVESRRVRHHSPKNYHRGLLQLQHVTAKPPEIHCCKDSHSLAWRLMAVASPMIPTGRYVCIYIYMYAYGHRYLYMYVYTYYNIYVCNMSIYFRMSIYALAWLNLVQKVPMQLCNTKTSDISSSRTVHTAHNACKCVTCFLFLVLRMSSSVHLSKMVQSSCPNN